MTLDPDRQQQLEDQADDHYDSPYLYDDDEPLPPLTWEYI